MLYPWMSGVFVGLFWRIFSVFTYSYCIWAQNQKIRKMKVLVCLMCTVFLLINTHVQCWLVCVCVCVCVCACVRTVLLYCICIVLSFRHFLWFFRFHLLTPNNKYGIQLVCVAAFWSTRSHWQRFAAEVSIAHILWVSVVHCLKLGHLSLPA